MTILKVSTFPAFGEQILAMDIYVSKGVPRLKNEKPLIIHDLDELANFTRGFVRRYENFLGVHNDFFEKVILAVDKLRGNLRGNLTVTHENIYVMVTVNEYYIELSSGCVLVGGKMSNSLFTLSFPPPEYLPNEGGKTVMYRFSDLTQDIVVKQVDEPYPRERAIREAWSIMCLALGQLGISSEKVNSSIDHVYAEIEYYAASPTLIIPVWDIVFYFKGEIKGGTAHRVLIDASNGNLIKAELLHEGGGPTRRGISAPLIALISVTVAVMILVIVLRRKSAGS